MRTDDFVPATAREIGYPFAVHDRWPPGKLRETAKAAYQVLARRGEILPQGIVRNRDGALVVRYDSCIPADWIHDELRRTEKAQA